MLALLIPGVGMGGSSVASVGKIGGDDVPYRKSPHRGWDESKSKLKLAKDAEFLADIRRMYRELTGQEDTREQAQEIIRAEVAPKAKPQVLERNQQRRSDMLRSRLDAVSRLGLDTEIAMRLLYLEYQDMMERADETAIQQILARLL